MSTLFVWLYVICQLCLYGSMWCADNNVYLYGFDDEKIIQCNNEPHQSRKWLKLSNNEAKKVLMFREKIVKWKDQH